MELVTKEYLEDNIKTYDTYRGLDKIGAANGIATLDANGLVTWSQIPQLGDPNGIATLDSNGTVPASQLDLTSVVTVTPSITSSDTGAYSVGSVTVNNTTVDLYGRDTPVTVTPGSIQSTDPDAYLAGTIVANGVTTDLYGKDTTYQKAQNDSLGLVMPGTNDNVPTGASPDNDWYPVAIDSAGHMYAQIPARKKWTTALNGQITATVTEPYGSGTAANYAGIRLDFPTTVLCTKLLYSPYNINTPQNAICKIAYKNPNGAIFFRIAATDLVIQKAAANKPSYLYASCITENGAYDLVLKINLNGKGDGPFPVDIL